ncbi:hypothetical protein [Micromonospora echinaurantiaca]|uniref:hypothetical protein n=1 Tax=Micromonospora echinaurantiaca TaxID=47857 RepID=UPI000D6F40F7|nr:hypothetical protein DLJ47_06780 [Micromonospora sp. S4605]
MAIFLAQFVALAVSAVLALDLPTPRNPLVMVVALLFGCSIIAAFSAALSAITRSSEAAMLTTLPTVVIGALTAVRWSTVRRRVAATAAWSVR